MSVSLKSLIGKLNDTCRSALEAAAGLCLTRTHYDVDIEHLFLKLSEVRTPIPAPPAALRDRSGAAEHATSPAPSTGSRRAMPAHRPCRRASRADSARPGRSPRSTSAPQGPLRASPAGAAGQRRSGAAGAGNLAEYCRRSLSRTAQAPARSCGRLGGRDKADAPAAAPEARGRPGAGGSKTPALDQYTIDLTARARQGEIDPVLGRDSEIRQVVDILTRRRQNNPILTGEAGVGKTAVVEGFALRIAQGDVPPPLQQRGAAHARPGLLQAGAGVKGEFENRLKSVIEEVKASPQPIILFIDEAHTMIGAGGQAGQGDAANLLKPALARGELRTIAATTWSEYKKYFEKDAALARRFQVVKVEEPTEAQAMVMMRGLVGDAREAPQRAHPGRGGRGRGAAVAPLHLRAAAAGQGGERARHGLRAGGAGPDGHPARGRGLRSAASTQLDGRRSAS